MSKNIGIEIDNEEICMAQFNGKKTVLSVRRLPENIISKEKIVSPAVMARFIKEIKKEAKISGKDCVMVIPEKHCYFRTVNMPVMSDAQLRLNLPYEFKDYIGSGSINYNFDYAIQEIHKDADGNPVSMDVYAACAEIKAMEEYADVLKRSGLRLKTALPRDMVMINLLKNSEAKNKDSEAVILEMSYDNLHLFIVKNGKIAGDKIIELGMKNVDLVISGIYNIDTYLAASYRENNHENILASAECNAVYESMALEVMKTVNFYKYENPESELNKIAFCGTGSLDENLINTVLDYIGFEIWDINHILPEACRDYESAKLCFLAVGAAL